MSLRTVWKRQNNRTTPSTGRGVLSRVCLPLLFQNLHVFFSSLGGLRRAPGHYRREYGNATFCT
jgi:hypothetical protein